MTYVVTEECIGCRWGDCVQVCPQRAFRAGPNYVVIDPQACANCGLCEMVCPEMAITAAHALTAETQHFATINARLAKSWPVAVDVSPLPDATTWSGKAAKLRWLVEESPH